MLVPNSSQWGLVARGTGRQWQLEPIRGGSRIDPGKAPRGAAHRGKRTKKQGLVPETKLEKIAEVYASPGGFQRGSFYIYLGAFAPNLPRREIDRVMA